MEHFEDRNVTCGASNLLTSDRGKPLVDKSYLSGLAYFLVALSVLCFTGYLCLAQSPSSHNAEAVVRGKKQFEASCSFCHGPDATGARAPDLVRAKLVNDDVNGNLIGPVILNGRPNNAMPAFTMSQQQIEDIAAFLHSQIKSAMDSANVSDTYPLSRLLTGNAQQGKRYFNGAGGCSACHSPVGDLAHIAGKYTPIELEGRMLYPDADLRTVTLTLPSGQKVEGRLLSLDEFSVALRDASGWYHSYSRSQVQVDVRDPLAAHRALLGRLTQADVHNLFAYLDTLK
ncbi:MAG: c-type cytochrome [Terriglobia bacterium]